MYGCKVLGEFKSRFKVYKQMWVDENKNKNFKYNKPEQKLSSNYRYNYENKNNYPNRDMVRNDKIKGRNAIFSNSYQ